MFHSEKLLFHTGKPFVSQYKTFCFTVQNFLFHNEKPVVSEQNCYSDLTMKDTPLQFSGRGDTNSEIELPSAFLPLHIEGDNN